MSKIKTIPIITFILFSVITFYFFGTLGFDYSQITNKDYIFTFYENSNINYDKSFLNNFLYLLLSTIYIFFLGFPLPLIIITSLIFDTYLAILISAFSISFGSFLTYIFFLKTIDFDLTIYSKKINELKKKFGKNEIFSVFIFRLISGGFPFLIQNLILFSLNFRKLSFFVGTFLSSVIGISVLILLGKNLVVFLYSIIWWEKVKFIAIFFKIYLMIKKKL